MGAEQLNSKRVETKVKKPFPVLLTGIVFILVIAVSILRIYFSKIIETPTLSLQEEQKLQNRLKEIDESVQYALIANEEGWYPCNHAGRLTFYLFAGEVWKYGTTTKGVLGRYSIKFLEKNNVSFLIQFHGTIGECMKEEQRKLFYYPYLPENLARPVPDRLPRPPYNSKMQ
jgi:hypothetical protein